MAGQLAPADTRSGRLMSVDALRGFDMFWIVGADQIVRALNTVSPTGFVNFLVAQLTHKDWEGVTFYDLIFPLFVFIVGVSLVFALSRTIEREGKRVAYKRIIVRSLLLFLLGVFYNGGLAGGVEKIRLLGPLQRIALSYLVASLLFCSVKLRGMIITCIALLVGYWALMTFVPVPGMGAGSFQEGANLANYIDRQFLPLRKWDGDHDPEGLLSTLPAIATCLLGVFAGLLLKNRSITDRKKVLWLLASGVAGVALGFLWSVQFPLVKKIWTSSYVLLTGGYSAILLAAFYQIIELWGRRKWAMPFVWIGMNAIAIYMTYNIVSVPRIAGRVVGGPVKEMFGIYGDVTITIAVLGLGIMFAWFLYHRKIFLRL